jgi:hypothetical protein
MLKSNASRGRQVRWWQSRVELRAIFCSIWVSLYGSRERNCVGPSAEGERRESGGDVKVKVKKSFFDK